MIKRQMLPLKGESSQSLHCVTRIQMIPLISESMLKLVGNDGNVTINMWCQSLT